MSVPVLLAVTGAPWEAEVVRRAEQAPGIRVVRRCVDIADVLGAAASGQARAVLLAEDLPRLTTDAVAALHARRIAVVALVDPADSGERCSGAQCPACDDTTDADAFRSLRGIGRSVQVGPASNGGAPSADFVLPDPAAVLQVLRWLASGSFASSG